MWNNYKVIILAECVSPSVDNLSSLSFCFDIALQPLCFSLAFVSSGLLLRLSKEQRRGEKLGVKVWWTCCTAGDSPSLGVKESSCSEVTTAPPVPLPICKMNVEINEERPVYLLTLFLSSNSDSCPAASHYQPWHASEFEHEFSEVDRIKYEKTHWILNELESTKLDLRIMFELHLCNVKITVAMHMIHSCAQGATQTSARFTHKC